MRSRKKFLSIVDTISNLWKYSIEARKNLIFWLLRQINSRVWLTPSRVTISKRVRREKKWCPCLCHLTWKHSLGIKYHQKNFYLLKTPPSNEAFRHSGGESRLCTSATVTLYLDVELSNDKRPGTLQNTSEGTIPSIIFSWWLPLWWWWSRDRIPAKFRIFFNILIVLVRT